MPVKRYTLFRRILNSLHSIRFFHVTKKFSLPFKIRRLKRKLAAIQLPDTVSSAENDPLFSSVEIETMNRCNGNCAFCPVNHKLDPRPFKKMSAELFHKIIDDLAQIDFRGTVNLFSNNEAFLDTRIYDFAEYAKKKLPPARIGLSSNGTLLDLEKYKRIIPHLDIIEINNYCTDYELKPNIAEIEQYAGLSPELSKKTSIHIRYEKQVMTTRGGQAPNAFHRLKEPLRAGCLRPIRQMIVRPDGKTSLCCNDALGTVTLGDVSADSVVAAWNSEAARDARRKVLRSRACFALCKGCDTV